MHTKLSLRTATNFIKFIRSDFWGWGLSAWPFVLLGYGAPPTRASILLSKAK